MNDMKSPERCLKNDPTISVLDMPEKIPDQAFDMPTCLKLFFWMVYVIIDNLKPISIE